MPLDVSQSGNPVSATSPNGSATFPLNITGVVSSINLSHYPSGSTALQASSGNVANAAAVATLTSAASRTAFISGLELTAAGSTAALVVVATITGLLGGTRSIVFTFPVGVTVAAQPIVLKFNPPLQASAVNTNIVVTLPAGGAGNTNAAASAHGYMI